jgi:hypothetical protein
MALQYLRHEQRSPYRIRLGFDQAVDTGAFAPAWYSIASLDSFGADPTVVAVLVVSGAAEVVELSLDLPLAPGGAYEITVSAGVPAVADTPLPADAFDRLVAPRPRPRVTVERSQADIQNLLYGEDLRHNGSDFVEQADGDLAGLLGVENAVDALQRAAAGNGLPWDEAWGAHLRELVDAPSPTVPTARGRVVAAMLADDRVRSADVVATAGDDGDVRIRGKVLLIGGEQPEVLAEVQR